MREFLKQTRHHIELDRNICVHNYDHAMKSKKFLDKFDDIKHKWEDFGLLEGLSGRTKDECAYCYEQLAVYLLTTPQEERKENVDEYWYNSFEIVEFAIIRRVISDLEPGKFNFNSFLKYVKEFDYYGLMDFVDKANPIVGPEPFQRLLQIDLEAEVVFLLCKMIVDKFNDPEKDSMEIKEKYMSEADRKIKEALKKKEDEGTSSDNTDA